MLKIPCISRRNALEHITMHPSVWPIIKELAGNKPCLCRRDLGVDTHEHVPNRIQNGASQSLALRAIQDGINSPRGFGEPGTLFCDIFNIFWCLTHVHLGDGGFIIASGSHRGQFDSPFIGTDFESAEDPPQGIVNITPKAGDAIICPKQCHHGALKWNPTDPIGGF